MVNEKLWNVYYLRFVVVVFVVNELLDKIFLYCVMFWVICVVLLICDC